MESVDYFPFRLKRTDWESAKHQLLEIRRSVFVEEQKVPTTADLDGQDGTAVHWLASTGDVPVGTARLLPEGVIGRMAVVKSQRGRGIGSAIVRQLINYAVREKIPQLTLSAQLHAISFYQRFGFEPTGEVYPDAGIDHRQMRLSLHLQGQRYGRHNSDDPDRQRIPLEGPAAFVDAALTVTRLANKKVRILSEQLLPPLYDIPRLCQTLGQLVIQQRSARIQVLLKDIDDVGRNTHRLHELSLRLPSHIEFRQLSTKTECLHDEFMLVDESRILYLQKVEPMRGFMVRHAPSDAKALIDEFDVMWQHGRSDPALRLLYL